MLNCAFFDKIGTQKVMPFLKRKQKNLGSKIKSTRLWTVAINRPKSRRFSQLSFEGFVPKGTNKLNTVFRLTFSFFSYIFKYFKLKTTKTLKIPGKVALFSVTTFMSLKAFMVRKLIWSQGKLGRPIATGVVMSVVLALFFLGKILNSSTLVVSQELDSGYLSSTTDIIPQTNTALTTVPESRKRNESFIYIVEPGDTLSSIGNKFKISTDALKYVNSLTDSSIIRTGQEIIIPPVSGLIHTVKSGDTLNSIARKYDVAPQAIADFNYILDTSKLALGTELVIPGAKVPEPVIPAAPSGPAAPPGNFVSAPSTGKWCVWPTGPRIITQYYSWYHNGIDIATPSGSAMPALFACAGGVVTRAGWDPFGLGLHVRIDHGNGFETVYGHMSSISVSYGQRVEQGQMIGVMGSTGRSTGPHVHFTVNYNGASQDPLKYTY
ncbi:MAG TPA: M23 family metallopeptidase [bacterium]|nr:M23 family metallopeptidase [bacterium]